MRIRILEENILKKSFILTSGDLENKGVVIFGNVVNFPNKVIKKIPFKEIQK